MDRHDLVVLGGGAPRATAQKLARPVVEEEGEHFAALEERRALENSSSLWARLPTTRVNHGLDDRGLTPRA